MFRTLTIQRSALVLLLASAVVAAPQAQTPPPDLTRTTYCTSGPFTLSGGTALFHLALDDDGSEPGGFVVMRVINQNGAVVKSKAVSIGAGASASLEYRGSGLYRVQAETFESPVLRPQHPTDVGGQGRAGIRHPERRRSDQAHRPGSVDPIPSRRDAVTIRRPGPMARRAVCRTVLALTGALALAWHAVVAAAGPAPDPYAACRTRFAQHPDDYESAFCFYRITIDQRRHDEGSRVFEDLIAAHPNNLWLRLAYGHVYRTRDPNRAERLYRQAADGFRASAGAEGEVLARSNLRDLLFPAAASTRPCGRSSVWSRSAATPEIRF